MRFNLKQSEIYDNQFHINVFTFPTPFTFNCCIQHGAIVFVGCMMFYKHNWIQWWAVLFVVIFFQSANATAFFDSAISVCSFMTTQLLSRSICNLAMFLYRSQWLFATKSLWILQSSSMFICLQLLITMLNLEKL